MAYAPVVTMPSSYPPQCSAEGPKYNSAALGTSLSVGARNYDTIVLIVVGITNDHGDLDAILMDHFAGALPEAQATPRLSRAAFILFSTPVATRCIDGSISGPSDFNLLWKLTWRASQAQVTKPWIDSE